MTNNYFDTLNSNMGLLYEPASSAYSADFSFFDTNSDAWDDSYSSSFLLSDFDISEGLGEYGNINTESSMDRVGDLLGNTGDKVYDFLQTEAGAQALGGGISEGLNYLKDSAAEDARNKRYDRMYNYYYDDMNMDADLQREMMALEAERIDVAEGELALQEAMFEGEKQNLARHNESIGKGPQRTPRRR